MNYGLTIDNIRCLAYQYAKKCYANYPVSWNNSEKSSRDWYYGFMNRHRNLSLRKPQPTSASRAKGFCKENVDAFFENFKNVLDEHKFEGHRIWNIDETGFATVSTKGIKVVAEKDSKVGQISVAERGTNVTMMMGVSATGQSIPPFYLFPRKNMKSSFLYHASPGSVGYANSSGRMTAPDFIKYMAHFIKHTNASKNNPLLLIFDNHTSHISIDCIDLAVENGISIVTIPPHCSHRMQPLDVGVYGPTKQFYASMVDEWMKMHTGRVFEIDHVAEVAEKAMELGLTPKNIKSGFASAGIYPLNSHIFTEMDFYAAEISGENLAAQEYERGEDARQVLVVSDDDTTVGATEEDSTSNTSHPSTSASLHSTMQEISPIKAIPLKPKSNRGRKSMKSTILTSSQTRSQLLGRVVKRKQQKPTTKTQKKKETKEKTTTKKTQAKNSSPPTKKERRREQSTSSSSSSAED